MLRAANSLRLLGCYDGAVVQYLIVQFAVSEAILARLAKPDVVPFCHASEGVHCPLVRQCMQSPCVWCTAAVHSTLYKQMVPSLCIKD